MGISKKGVVYSKKQRLFLSFSTPTKKVKKAMA